ncbi:prepilin-type N-terminal cleavage/methylation domain-containing protein [Lysobacter yangpyeongensis]|uniref:Prepilin-type N-terminal cleavage/methylation domain-containing protein n=1 Tax=Lysobacter yangpyeongensis TaxID=346182 RepID=A0ABW0SKJ6_9GAMM
MVNHNNRLIRNGRGFSLIEVMIAVVVLSTGLLALAALQANLVRTAADSKARSRVAALVSSHMDAMRAGGYDGAQSMAATGCASGNDVCQAQTEGAVGGLTIAHEVNEVALNATAHYKTVRMVAQWTDAGGQARSLSMNTVLSPTALDASATLVDKDLSGDSSKQPIVRTTNPATPGMIPIAVSATDSTAATNPRPELLSKGNNSIVGTKFDVLTYTNETGGNVQIQRRVETTVVACTCQYGAGGTNLPEIYREAQWPAIWTGERYDIYKPDSSTLKPPGATALTGPASGVEQSPLCTECCRDHHDSDRTDVAKFDPERVLQQGEAVDSHYTRDKNGTLVLADAANKGTYEESCRMIRVDGLWRTAADMYSRYTALIPTGVASGKTAPATTGVPDATAADNYGGSPSKGISGFVKDYLAELMQTASSSVGADKLYDDYGLNNPAELAIQRPTGSTTDERYLHLRGLYVDHLEEKAKERIKTALLPTNCPGNKTECVLPYVPFTTVNLTELAYWKSQVLKSGSFIDDSSILKVETASSLTYNATEPYRGRTNALTNANNTDAAYATATITRSNSGVAVMQQGVDPDDDTVASELPDRQLFTVSASGSGSNGAKFTVNLAGLPQTSDNLTTNDPSVDWLVSSNTGSCGGTLSSKQDDDPNDYSCNNVTALDVAGSVIVSNYYREHDSTSTKSFTFTCSSSAGDVSVTGNLTYPQFDNYKVLSAVVGTTKATGVAGVPQSPSNDKKKTEKTQIDFTNIPANSTVWVDFAKEETIDATILSCTATRQNANKPWVFGNVTWNRPWE